MSLAHQPIIDEHDLYPLHEEDTVPDTPEHEYQARYLRDALATCFPRHLVTGEVCMYWHQGDTQSYVAPDVLVVEGLGEERLRRVYLSWSDPTALLVVEVGSRSTFRKDTGPKVDRYLNDLAVREYLYCGVERERLQIWRREGDEIVSLTAAPLERLHSRELGVDFRIEEDGFLRVYGPNGEALPTHRELAEEVARLREELKRREAGPGGH